MLTRRTFLTALLGAGAALAIVPRLEALGLTPASLDSAALDAPGLFPWDEAYLHVLQQSSRDYVRMMRAHGLECHMASGAKRMGDCVPMPGGWHALITNHYHVVLRETDLRGPHAYERCVVPAIASLVEPMSYDDVNAYAALELPTGCAFAGRHGPLRMLVVYDVEGLQHLVRFDVCGGRMTAVVAAE